jgi:hypothetical protein
MLTGCRYDPAVWRYELTSPDGAWVATARTDQWGGFGTAWVETTVSLRRVNGTLNRGKPFDIFSYPNGGRIPKTYVLSNENADENLYMAWLAPTHLQIDRLGDIDPYLEVIRFSTVDVSFRLK